MFDIHTTTAPAFTIAVDGDDFRFMGLNSECLRASGSTLDAQLGKRPQDYFGAPLGETLQNHYRRCVESRKPVSYEVESILQSGYACWRTTLVPIVSPETGDVTSLVGVCIDTTTEKLDDRAGLAFHEKLSLAIGAVDGGFWIYDVATDQFEASRPLTDLFAGPGHPLLNLADYINFIYPEDLAGFPDLTRDSTADFRIMTFDGRTRWLHSRRRVRRDVTGKVTHLVALVMDVTDQKLCQRALEVEASTDDLTGLKNRRCLERIGTTLIGYPFDEQNPVSLLLIDLDGFKPVNDQYGHQAGDRLLQEVARRIARLVRSEDTLARIGGDEFAILIRKGLPARARMMERLQRAFSRPFRAGANQVGIGASIGIATQERTDRTLATLVDRADKALYAIKNDRRRLTA